MYPKFIVRFSKIFITVLVTLPDEEMTKIKGYMLKTVAWAGNEIAV
jgi:hypothetical protein